MKPHPLCRVCLFVALFAGIATGQALAEPRGVWLAKDGAFVLVNSCGNGLCGMIIKAASQLDPSTGRAWTDKNNPDPNKRNRPLVGVQVLSSMMPSGPGKWSGSLYNADDGKTYPGNLIEVDAKTIRVEGCGALNICDGENLSRIK
jgi:uncharacterized protein (DUF2147 family)